MKPGKNNTKTDIKIQGDKLLALQKISFVFVECFGLDLQICNYKDARSIGLYQFDFECLITGIEFAITNDNIRNALQDSDLNALENLLNHINEIYKTAYRS